jgi:hypothetical protein
VTLNSAGGGVSVVNVRPTSSEDSVEVGTVSGDIQLDLVANAEVTIKTVNGNVTMTGPLARAGTYGFMLMGGDLTMKMPHDASFKLNATVSERRDIVSDFPLTYLSENPSPTPSPTPEAVPTTPEPKVKSSKGVTVVSPIIVAKPVISGPNILRRFNAICGKGDASISVSSFGGTLLLKKL